MSVCRCTTARSSLPEMAVAAHGVLFAPEVTALADKVLEELAAGGRPFYGVHLRIEQDWVSFGREVGGLRQSVQ